MSRDELEVAEEEVLMAPATLELGIALCRMLEPIADECGGHVALTGGCLYRDGERKDVDILICCYRSSDEPAFNWDLFWDRIRTLNFFLQGDYGFCKKARYVLGPLTQTPGREVRVDFFDPHGVYVPGSSSE